MGKYKIEDNVSGETREFETISELESYLREREDDSPKCIIHCSDGSAPKKEEAPIEHRMVNVEDVFRIVEKESGIDRESILGASRLDDIVKVREIICHFCVEYLKVSQSGMGRILNRNHATIYHYLWNHYYSMMYAPYRDMTNRIRKEIEKITGEPCVEHPSGGTRKHLSERYMRHLGVVL